MRSRLLQTIAAVAAVAIVAPLLKLGGDGQVGARSKDGTVRISERDRAATARFAPNVPAADRAWIEAAVATARPEAQRLIAEVDGLVEYQVHYGDPFAVTRPSIGPRGASFVLSFDVGSLDRTRRQDRNPAVLHEYGHVVDISLVPPATNAALEAGIPRTGSCTNWGDALTGACAEPMERFADTFAKWALRGHFSVVGGGYAVATPPSLEDWGAPLGVIANQLPAS